MDPLKRWSTLATTAGLLSLAAMGFAHLALTDIGHGEPDLSAEWLVVQVAFGLILAFHALALGVLFKIRRQ